MVRVFGPGNKRNKRSKKKAKSTLILAFGSTT